MNELLKVVLSLSISGSLFILILLFCKPLIKHRISMRWQYYIWLVVVARLLLPFTPEASPVGTLFMEVDRAIVQTDTIPLPGQNTVPATQPENDVAIGNDNTPKNETAPTTATLSLQKVLSALFQNLWLIWLVVALILFIRKITIYQGFVRYIKAGRKEVSDIALLDQLALLGEQVGVKKPVELFTNDLISSPLLLGFFRPCIVLPTTNLPDSDFQYTLLHELTHFKRLDMFYKWLVQLTICLHWFNPLAYIMGRKVNRLCELSCDESVIKERNPEEQRIYGDTLLNAMGVEGDYKDSLASVTLTKGKELLKERLNAIMVFKKKSVLAISTAILLTFVFCFGASAVGAYAISPSTNLAAGQQGQQVTTLLPAETGKSKPAPISYVIECVSEKIIVQQGGTDFKIEVDPASQGNYTLRDNRNVPMGERYYRYNKWDIVFARNNELSQSAILSSTITLTIPESLNEQELCLVTSNGNIQVENLNNVNLTIESESGGISIKNTNATSISAKAESGNIQLEQMTSTGDIVTHSNYGTVSIALGESKSQYSVEVNTESEANITINGQRYNGGAFTVGSGGKQIITLDGENNSFTLSNIRLFGTAVSNTSDKNSNSNEQDTESYWTEKEFISFMQEQERQYKALLASGDITQSEYDTFISTDKAMLKKIQQGIEILKSATGNIKDGIGTSVTTNKTNISLNEIGANEAICIGKISLDQGINYRFDITAESGEGLFVALYPSNQIVSTVGVGFSQHYGTSSRKINAYFHSDTPVLYYVYVGNLRDTKITGIEGVLYLSD